MEIDGQAVVRDNVENDGMSFISKEEFLGNEFGNSFTGEIVSMGENPQTGEPISIELVDGDPQEAIKALVMVKSVNFVPTLRKFNVDFNDETQALVVSRPPFVTFIKGKGSKEHSKAALYAVQAYAARLGGKISPEQEELARAAGIYQDMRTPEALRDYANAAVAYNESIDYENLTINDPSLMSAPEESDDTETTTITAKDINPTVLDELWGNRNLGGGQSLLYAAKEDGTSDIPTDLATQRRDAAIRLGGEHLIPENLISMAAEPRETGEIDAKGNPIYATDDDGNIIMQRVSKGEYYVSSQVGNRFEQVKNLMIDGKWRFAIDRSDPGLGKNAFWRQVGAQTGMAVMEINLGPNFDINDAIGGDGLEPTNIYEEKTVPVESGKFNKDGTPIYALDSEGEVKTKKIRELKASTTASVQKLGPLTRYAKEPCIIVINEPEGVEDTLVQLNEAFGSRIGDSSGRYISVNSTHGETSHPVHEDCIIALTYNPGPNEIQMPHSVHSRAVNFHMDPMSDEEDAKKLASMITKVMDNQTGSPGLKREWTDKEVMPMVQMRKQLQNLHRTNPEEWIALSDDRQAALMFTSLMKSSYAGRKSPISTMLETQRYLLPGSYNMDKETRDTKLRDIIQDQVQELMDLSTFAKQLRAKHDKEQEEKEKKQKGGK